MSIPARIRAARLSRGLSQGEAARLLGVSPTAFNRYERGTRLPDAHMIPRIAEILGTTVGEIIEGYQAEGSGSSILQTIAERPDLYNLMKAAYRMNHHQVALLTAFVQGLGLAERIPEGADEATEE
jgi:transcriptional regulator with XRE-family HTH domain